MARDGKKLWSVTQVNAACKQMLEEQFPAIWITGEISNLTIHRSRQIYFSIKDDNSQIDVVMFNGQEKFTSLGIENGQIVNLYGKLNLYLAGGRYQFVANFVELEGQGDWQKKIQELKEQLYKKGIFDQKHKKKLPRLPKKIGLITSSKGAAVEDFIAVSKKRFPSVNILIYPSAVQGEFAHLELIKGIQYFNERNLCDIIVLTRGGGSAEDLMCFNNEDLVMEIFHSKIPLISAIGHEIDTSLTDFAADLQCPTPSAAAESVVPEKQKFLQELDFLQQDLNSIISQILTNMKNKLLQIHAKVSKFSPKLNLLNEKYKLNNYKEKSLMFIQAIFAKEKMQQANLVDGIKQIPKIIAIHKQQLDFFIEQLQLINPKNILKRGYSITSNKDGKIIKSLKEAEKQQQFYIEYFDGKISVKKK